MIIAAEVKPLIAILTFAIGGGASFALHKLCEQRAVAAKSVAHNSNIFK